MRLLTDIRVAFSIRDVERISAVDLIATLKAMTKDPGPTIDHRSPRTAWPASSCHLLEREFFGGHDVLFADVTEAWAGHVDMVGRLTSFAEVCRRRVRGRLHGAHPVG